MSQPVEQQRREEIVYTDTEDGVLLQGTSTLPDVQTGPTAVFVHGHTVSANLPFTTRIARAFALRGHAFLAANTRGHNLATWLFRIFDPWVSRLAEAQRPAMARGRDVGGLAGSQTPALGPTAEETQRR